MSSFLKHLAWLITEFKLGNKRYFGVFGVDFELLQSYLTNRLANVLTFMALDSLYSIFLAQFSF